MLVDKTTNVTALELVSRSVRYQYFCYKAKIKLHTKYYNLVAFQESIIHDQGKILLIKRSYSVRVGYL